MKILIIASGVLALMLSGCGNDDSKDVDFDRFVIKQIESKTSDTNVPADIDDVNFVYSENGNEFDSLLD